MTTKLDITTRLQNQIKCFEQEYNSHDDDTWETEINLCKDALAEILILRKEIELAASVVDTPRTNKCIDEMCSLDIGWDRLADHARQLERELKAANSSMSFLDDALNSGDGSYRP